MFLNFVGVKFRMADTVCIYKFLNLYVKLFWSSTEKFSPRIFHEN